MTTVPARVLMLLENFTYPEDQRVRREALALLEAGHEVSVICPGTQGQPRREIISGVRVYRYRVPRSGDGLLGYAWEYGYSLLRTFMLSLLVVFRPGFDIIHLHNPPDFPIMIAALYKLLGKRIVFDQHDLAPDLYYARFDNQGNRLVHRVLLAFERLSCRLADLVIATNESYKRVEIERCGVQEERIAIVRNGPDLTWVGDIESDPKVQARAEYIVGYLGDIGFHDGLDYLIRALHHLATDLGRKNFCCVVIGKGDALQSAKDLAGALDLTDHVWFTGYLPSVVDVMRYLAAAHVCVDPDPSNPFTDRSTMNKIMEYMALARPVVAFDLPEHRVSAERAAVYARANDELDFARQIAALLDDPQRRREMGRFGRERVATKLAWPYQKESLIAAYARLTK
jgi:glycosyltransferase involved in cell wall biosynthesis